MPEITGRLRTPRLSAAPSSPIVGEMYYDTTTNKLMWWNNTTWTEAGGAAGGSDPLKVDKDSVVVAATRVVANKLLVGDTQPSFQIEGSGRLRWGVGGTTATDVTLYRSAANNLRTDSIFIAATLQAGSAATGAVNAGVTTLKSALTTLELLRIMQTSDIEPRISLSNDAIIRFGPGGFDPADASISRSATATLRLEAASGFYLGTGNRFAIDTTSGALNWGDGTSFDNYLRRDGASLLGIGSTFRIGSTAVTLGSTAPVANSHWLGIANTNASPTGSTTGGGVLYVSAGRLFYRGTSGTETQLAPA